MAYRSRYTTHHRQPNNRESVRKCWNVEGRNICLRIYVSQQRRKNAEGVVALDIFLKCLGAKTANQREPLV